jgi:hypothetical protein
MKTLKTIKEVIPYMAYVSIIIIAILSLKSTACNTGFKKSEVESLVKRNASASSELAFCFRVMESGKAGANMEYCSSLIKDSTKEGIQTNYFNCVKENKSVDKFWQIDCKAIYYPRIYKPGRDLICE